MHVHAVQEARMLFFPVLDDAFAKTSMPPSIVGALVVNYSGFCPASTHTSITANRYRIHADGKTLNLSSMCCGASSIRVDNTTGIRRAHCMSTVVLHASADIQREDANHLPS
ncbi:hypothetical protein QYE76_017412 [Lolium multiflorum]|uniref:FAE domain-containing protein n=1 Tax=Lolium multiflorum TaxID=4521 RepID=A0AAD8QEE3_LOLMU|nr:hypothetical protein QYE76_017412 [Lolium multiflorum]